MDTSAVQTEQVPWLQSSSEQKTVSEKKDTLDKDDFLKLLITELKYQNPLEPMNDKDFIAQMASFSSLEQMKNLNTGFENLSNSMQYDLLPGIQLQQATAMIGREVTYLNDKYETVEGKVDSVILNQGIPYCVIGDKAISIYGILGVKNAGSTSDTIPSLQLQQALAMIGCEVSYLNDNKEEVEGRIDSVKLKQGIPYCVIGGNEISIDSILSIKNAGSTDDTVLQQILDQLKTLTDKMAPETGDGA